MNKITVAKTKRSVTSIHYAAQFHELYHDHIIGLTNKQRLNPFSYFIPSHKITISARLGAKAGGLILTVRVRGTHYYKQVEHTVYHSPDWIWYKFSRYAENLLRRALYLHQQRALAKPLLDFLKVAIYNLDDKPVSTQLDFLEDAHQAGYDPGTELWSPAILDLELYQLEQLCIYTEKHL